MSMIHKRVDHSVDLGVVASDIAHLPTFHGVTYPCKIKLERVRSDSDLPTLDVTLYMPAGSDSEPAIHMVLAKSATYKVRNLAIRYVLTGVLQGDDDRIAKLEHKVEWLEHQVEWLEHQAKVHVEAMNDLLGVCNALIDRIERLETITAAKW